ILMAVLFGAPVLYFTRSYLDHLTELARTDRAAAISGFTTWVLPQLILIAVIGLAAGGWPIRERLRADRTRRCPPSRMWVVHDPPLRRGGGARRSGILFVLVGATLALFPTLSVAVLVVLLSSAR